MFFILRTIPTIQTYSVGKVRKLQLVRQVAQYVINTVCEVAKRWMYSPCRNVTVSNEKLAALVTPGFHIA
jgi:hypothetical protein